MYTQKILNTNHGNANDATSHLSYWQNLSLTIQNVAWRKKRHIAVKMKNITAMVII